jgi:transposase
MDTARVPVGMASAVEGALSIAVGSPGASSNRKGLPKGVSGADPEVVPDKARRRRFSAKYKRQILDEADACAEPGQVGALLRREGLYSSHLTAWRKQRDAGALAGLTPKKRGRKPRQRNPLEKQVQQLERDKARLERELEKSRIIIEYQKKASEILGIPLRMLELDDKDDN